MTHAIYTPHKCYVSLNHYVDMCTILLSCFDVEQKADILKISWNVPPI